MPSALTPRSWRADSEAIGSVRSAPETGKLRRVPAVRENLEGIAGFLAPVGFTATDGARNLRLWPLPGAALASVSALGDVETVTTPTHEQMEVLAIVGFVPEPSRALIERCRQQDAASLLDRLTAAGLLARGRDDAALDQRVALRATGVATVEALTAAVIANVSAADLVRPREIAAGAGDGSAPSGRCPMRPRRPPPDEPSHSVAPQCPIRTF